MRKILSALFALFSTGAFALVDYSSPVQADVLPTKTKAISAPQVNSVSNHGSSNLAKYIALNSGVEILDVAYRGKQNKVSIYTLGGHFQTPYNIFLDAVLWAAQSENSTLTTKRSIQMGNPLMKLGFNWLTLGAQQDLATFDIYAAINFAGAKNSSFASSRNDTMFGIELTKRFYDLALQLTYEYRLVGKNKLSEETPIGNTQKVMASLGWRVSSDIRFALEGSLYNVGKNKLNRANAGLSNDLNFASLSPKLGLGLASFLDLEIGALYRTRSVDLTNDIVDARLWDMKGLYGNSIFANLILSL